MDNNIPRITLYNYITKEIELVYDFESIFDFGELIHAKLHPNGLHIYCCFKNAVTMFVILFNKVQLMKENFTVTEGYLMKLTKNGEHIAICYNK